MGQPPVSARRRLPVSTESLLERMHLDDVAALVVGWEDNAGPPLEPASSSSSAATVRPRRAA